MSAPPLSPPMPDAPAAAALRQVLDGIPEAAVTVDARGRVTECSHAGRLQQLGEAILHGAPYSVMVIGLDGLIIDVNPATEALLGYRRDELIGQSPRLFHDEQEVLQRAARPSADMGREIHPGPELFFQQREFHGHQETEWTYVRKDGSRVPVGLSVGRLIDRDGRHHGSVRLSIDLTERRGIAERLRHMAEHDVLTGFYNRAALQVQLELAVERARGQGRPFGLMFIDLDRFKQINDTLGHEAGDELLRQVAQRLAGAARASDVVARMGGDEFVLLLPELGTEAEADMVAAHLMQALCEPHVLGGVHELHVSASIGIALCPLHGSDGATLMRRADGAMYRAKRDGRSTWRIARAGTDTQSSQQLRLQSGLHRALERNELRLHYQPQFDLASGSLRGAEALLRWEHEGRLVSPAEFIPLAEEWGLIVPIGRWVLQEACRQAADWRRRGLVLCMAVNLSPVQIADGTVLPAVQQALQATGLPPNLLELEITEGAIVRDHAAAAALLHDLRAWGVRIAIDDFGVGYSSLSYLQELPVDRIKIDRVFLRGIQPPPAGDHGRLVAALVAMGRSLELRITAEGVETPVQADFLRRTGCDEVQGYLYGKPCDAGRFEQQWLPRMAVPAHR